MGASTERAYVKHAWLIIFVIGLLTAISSPIGLLGIPPNPPSPEVTTRLTLNQISARIPGMIDYIGSISRQLGNFMLVMGVLTTAIGAVPYRKGEKWAWYVCWILPTFMIIQLVNSNFGYLWQLDLIFLFAILAGLLMPYRRFFPEKH